MKKVKKRKLKKRNLCLLVIGVILSICLLLEVSYTHWILKGDYPLLKVDSSEEVKNCYKNGSYLLSDCLSSLVGDDLVKVDNDIRYVGSNPNNYIDIGERYISDVYRGYSKTNELDYKDYSNMGDCINDNRKCSLYYQKGDAILWRIIGVFFYNNTRYVKIVRNDTIGEFAWDSSDSMINDGQGVNNWSTSKLFDLLNHGLFFNRESGSCVVKSNNETSDCDFTNNGLDKNVISLIKDMDWSVGSMNEDDFDKYTVSNWYERERNTLDKACLGGIYCTDEIERESVVSSRVGLLYPSDVLYASSNQDRDNWLTLDKTKMWFITPVSSLSSNAYVTMYDDTLKVAFASNKADIYPTVYLDYDVIISGGYGTKDSPYVVTRK